MLCFSAITRRGLQHALQVQPYAMWNTTRSPSSKWSRDDHHRQHTYILFVAFVDGADCCLGVPVSPLQRGTCLETAILHVELP
jgi:hypothetical protein